MTGSGRTVALSFAVPSEVLDMIPRSHVGADGQAPVLPKQLHEIAK